jgi:hypothetical protein
VFYRDRNVTATALTFDTRSAQVRDHLRTPSVAHGSCGTITPFIRHCAREPAKKHNADQQDQTGGDVTPGEFIESERQCHGE